MTQPELKQFLQRPLSRAEWLPLLRSLFKRVDIFATPQQLFQDQQLVKSGGQFGMVTLEDGKSIALFEVEVEDSVVIERNRVALRGIASRYIDQFVSHGALVFSAAACENTCCGGIMHFAKIPLSGKSPPKE